MFTDADFEALDEHRKAQRQPHVDDIRLCDGCDRHGQQAGARGERRQTGARASASFLTQTVVADKDTYEVMWHTSGDWSESYKGRLGGGGTFDINRPSLESDGSKSKWQSPGEGLSNQFAEEMHDVALETATNCNGPSEQGICPVAQAVADRMVQSVLDHPHFAPQLDVVPE